MVARRLTLVLSAVLLGTRSVSGALRGGATPRGLGINVNIGGTDVSIDPDDGIRIGGPDGIHIGGQDGGVHVGPGTTGGTTVDVGGDGVTVTDPNNNNGYVPSQNATRPPDQPRPDPAPQPQPQLVPPPPPQEPKPEPVTPKPEPPVTPTPPVTPAPPKPEPVTPKPEPVTPKPEPVTPAPPVRPTAPPKPQDASPQNVSSLTCDTLGPHDVHAEPSCQTALPSFYGNTTSRAYQMRTAQQRKEVLDRFCGSACGRVYTAAILARQLKCPTSSSATSIDRAAASVGNQTQAVADFAPFYPGLELGCIKDPKDNVFCGLKRGDAQAGDCTFYYSCCYAELEKTTSSTDTDKARVEEACPGARSYLTKGVCAM